jgi:hypothetical protein
LGMALIFSGIALTTVAVRPRRLPPEDMQP